MKPLNLLSVMLIPIAFLVISFTEIAPKWENQICYGPSVKTEELNNAFCRGVIDQNHVCIHGGSQTWIFHKYKLTVSAPNGWHFTGNPSLHCVQDNQGSFGWNMGYANHYLITQSTPKFKEMEVYISSRSITVNLQCQATKE